MRTIIPFLFFEVIRSLISAFRRRQKPASRRRRSRRTLLRLRMMIPSRTIRLPMEERRNQKDRRNQRSRRRRRGFLSVRVKRECSMERCLEWSTSVYVYDTISTKSMIPITLYHTSTPSQSVYLSLDPSIYRWALLSIYALCSMMKEE
jgi:hypothetical protein